MSCGHIHLSHHYTPIISQLYFTTLVSLATFSANVPVIFVTFRSRRFENDSAAKMIASLAVSDIVNGVIAVCCAGVAWSLEPGDQVPTWLQRLIYSGMYTFGLCFGHLAPKTTWN